MQNHYPTYQESVTFSDYYFSGVVGDVASNSGGVPHGGVMFYDESGAPLYVSGLGSENIIHTVSSGDISSFQNSLSNLNPKSSPLTLSQAQLLGSVYGSKTYDNVIPVSNGALVYSMPSFGSWIGMFASMGGDGFVRGYNKGNVYFKPGGDGLGNHYDMQPGMENLWLPYFASQRFQKWW